MAFIHIGVLILLTILSDYADAQLGIVPITVPLGRRVVLQCKPRLTDNDFVIRYEWRRSDRVIGEGKSYAIPKISLDNAGIYVCRVYYRVNGVIKHQDASHRLQIKDGDEFSLGGGANRKPEFRISVGDKVVQDETTFNETAFLFLKCDAKNGESYRWLGPNNIQRKGKVLYLPDISMRHEGTYTCYATFNEIGEQSHGIRVKIRRVDVNMMSYNVEKFEVGGKISRSCTPNMDSLKGTSTIKWVDPSGRVIVQGNLINMDITESTPSGEYSCQLFKYGTSTPIAIKYFTVNIKSERKPRIREPTFVINQVPSKVVEGEQVTLFCGVTEDLKGLNLNLERKWYKNNEFLTTGEYLLVQKFEVGNSEYTCRLSGRDPDSGRLFFGSITHVIVGKTDRQQIEMTDGQQTIVVREGDSKEIHCELTGDGQIEGVPTTKWFFNNGLMNRMEMLQSNIVRNDHTYTSILTFRSFKKENEGLYKCVRRDGSEMQVKIIVEKVKGEINVNPRLINANIGGKAEFHCQISGTSTLNSELTWLFEPRNSGVRRQVDFSRWRRHDLGNTFATTFIELEDVRNRDDGFYHCYSQADQLFAKAELRVIRTGSSKIISITPERVVVRPRQRISMTCRVTVNGQLTGRPKFYFTNNRPVDTTPSFTQKTGPNGEVELIVAGGLERNAGQVPVICREGADEQQGLIVVTTECPPGQRPCRDSQSCILQESLCNGIVECGDKSDEDPAYCKQCDPLTKKCQDYNGKSPLKSYYQSHWECDGEDDCGNFFDESRCNKAEFTSCGGTTHKCAGQNNITIPRAFVCDNEDDCPTGTDETRCSVPQITSPSPGPYRVSMNDRISLTCRATGYPLPRIIWRFNWGCLPDEKRMVVFNSNNNCFESVSRLEISRFQRGDDGIYNCEALIGQRRVLSNDYSVTLQTT